MRDKTTRQYTNGEITVVWKPDLCIHSGICWNGLPDVFNPRTRPWIAMAGALSDDIVAQVDQCPSGALSWFRTNAAEKPALMPKHAAIVEVMPDGPLLVRGNIVVKDGQGGEKNRGPVTAFCRCGHSGNKPYCDGSHAKSDFKE